MSLGDGLEPFLGLFVSWIDIWVVFSGKVPVSPLDILLRGFSIHPEDPIVVLVIFPHLPL